MILLLTGCSESKKLSTNQSEDNNQIKYKSKDITINENLLKENIKKISSNVRNYGSDGEIESSEYINNQLTKYGYSVMFQEFDVYKQDQYTTVQSETNLDYLNNNFYNSDSIGKARNIIATQRNFDKNKKTLYLTAHYDSTSDTIGIVDNASGSATVLELARVLSDYNDEFNIGIVFFSAEEYFRSGSRKFVSSLDEDEKNNILGCINIDMVGEKGKGPIIMQTVNGENNIMSIMMDKLTNKEFNLSGGGSSDDLSFYMGEIPVINLCNDYAKARLYDDAEDNIESIDFNQIKELCESILNAITDFKLSMYNKFLKDYKDIDLDIDENDIKLVGEFKLINKKETLIGNGYDVQKKYTYQNNEGKTCTIMSKSVKFIPKEQLNNLILLDEPTNHLDFKHQIELLENLSEWVKKNNKIVIGVLHDLNLVQYFADNVLMIKSGEGVSYGKPEDVFKRDVLNDIYGIDIKEFMLNILEKWA